MKMMLWTAAALFSAAVFAEVGPGENILLNGRLETDQTDLPLYWSVGGPKGTAIWEPSGGPGGIPCMTFRNPEGKKGEFTLRQYGIRLATNGTYRISAMLRTKGFRSRNCGAVVVNQGWNHAHGPKGFASDLPWTRFEKTFKPVKSSDGRYSAVVFAVDPVGELSVADFRMEALDAVAQAETQPSSAAKASRTPRLLTWGTDLLYIPRAKPEIAFRAFGHLPPACDLVVGPADSSCAPEAGAPPDRDPGAHRPPVRVPLLPKLTTVALPADQTGGTLTARVVDRAGGTNVCSSTFAYRVVDPVDTTGHRRLNNLVREVLTAKAGSAPLHFTTTRDGWVFVSVKPQGTAPAAFTVALDGRKVMDASTPRLETFRQIPYGRHMLAVTGADGAHVVVRQIAEVFNYCPGANSLVKENPPYDWAFQRKYGHPAVTTQNGGSIPKEHRDWFRGQGYLWLANLGTTKLKDSADMLARLQKAAGLNEPCYDGVTCDEQFFGQPDVLSSYMEGLRAYPNPKDRLIYTWIVGKPGTPGVDHDFLRASADASRGRGRVMFEAYCRTRATEEQARAYMDDYVTDTLRRYDAWCPGIAPSVGIAFGDFNQVPILSLAHHPEVDYKYYLDMQLNLVATSPAFEGLGCTGYWGSYYADHELHRWAMRLLRHYCVEGRTDMLSAQYGYRYLPGTVANGDFRGTLDGWTATGDVKTDSHKGFGSRAQNRWGGNGGLGDTFAVFTRTAGATNALTQTVRGLVPGRKYCLQFAAFDADDAKADRIAPRQFGVRATLGDGAEVVPELSWLHVDKRVKGRYAHNNGVARINLRHVVFTARAPEVVLTLDDADAKPGEHLAVNYVSVNPFFEE